MLDLPVARWVTSRRMPPPPPVVTAMRCREIIPSDLDQVIDLLTGGFQGPTRDAWAECIKRLSLHHTPAGYPKYGYVLENGGTLVGVLLLIFTERMIDGKPTVLCNESSYYVDPQFRPYAAILVHRLRRHKNATYVNVTSASDRWATLEAQGYRRFAQGVYLAIPALARTRGEVRIHPLSSTFDGRLDASDFDLLTEHTGYGCLSLVCEYQSRLYPFVFAIQRKYGVPFAYLIYSKSHNEFVNFAAAIGRYLIKQGIPLMLLDADGPIAGIPGRMTNRRPKYWRGPVRPRIGDLAYTEIPMFGFI